MPAGINLAQISCSRAMINITLSPLNRGNTVIDQPPEPSRPTGPLEPGAPSSVEGTTLFQIDLNFAGRQDVGCRSKQEDFYAFCDGADAGEPPLSKLLIGLGDGLGAHAGGNIASAHLVNEFLKAYKQSTLAESWRLRVALETANESLADISRGYALDEPPMGSTFIGLHISATSCQWISVGDSPLFIFRNGRLERLNADHSLTPLLAVRVKNGEITEQEALVHPDRHILQSACMGQPLTMVDTRSYPYELHSGDILIAASDGILTLDPKEIEALLQNGRKNTAASLVDSLLFAIRCIDHPRQDNVTIALIKIP